MNDLQLFVWRFATAQLPDAAGSIAALALDPTAVPGLFQYLSDGWTPISHTFGSMDGDALLTILMQRPSAGVTAPDDASSIPS